jgi:RHS repeat-associated protein
MQEQELQETGFYSFKWRNYMPDVGRFFNIDPLSEKYAYQSHYNFAENRVIDGRELEGLEWSKNTAPNNDGTKTYTANGNFKVLNKAQDVISNDNLKYYFPRFTKQMEDSYNGPTTSGDQLKVGKVNYQIVDRVDTTKDYYIEFTTQIVEKDGTPSTADGKVDKIGNTQINRMQINVETDNLAGVVAHEVNHTAGNRHQNDPQNEITDASTKIIYDNMMSSPTQTGNKLIPEQRDIMLKNIPDEKTP